MNKTPSSIERAPILADRIRSIAGQGFAFIPHRFLKDGFLASLGPDELLLYFFLVLAADRYGVSFYHYETMCSLLQLPADTFIHARRVLMESDLVAFDGRRYQVLSLPSKTARTAARALHPEDLEDHDPVTIRDMIVRSLGDPQE